MGFDSVVYNNNDDMFFKRKENHRIEGIEIKGGLKEDINKLIVLEGI